MSSTLFEYHVAISFAGENREIAEAIANCLKQFDVQVFYDRLPAETSILWGKNGREHFPNIYENKARYCLIIFSEHYLDPNNEWTQIEFDAALKRQRREQEYILLLKVDDTSVPCGLPKTVLYLQWTWDAKPVCETLLWKLPEHLIWTLKYGRSWDVIETAAELLGKKREFIAIEPLIQALLYRDKRIRKRVAEALVYRGEPAVEPLIQHLKDKGWEIPAMQKWVPWVLGKIGEPAVKPLLELFTSDNQYVKHYAVVSLEKVGEPAVDPLILKLQDKNPSVRYRSAEALGYIRSPRAVEPLIELLKDENKAVRISAARALMWIRDPLAIEPLMKSTALIVTATMQAMNRGDKGVLIAVIDALVEMGIDSVDYLIKALDDGSWLIRRVAVSALWKIEDPRAIEPLIKVLMDEHFDVRYDAVYVLGDIGDARAIAPLTEMLKDSNMDIRRIANEALEEIKKRLQL